MRYKVQDPTGQTHFIEGPEGATPEQVLAQAQKILPDTSGVGGAVSQQKYPAQPEPSRVSQFIEAERQTPIPGVIEARALPGQIESAAEGLGNKISPSVGAGMKAAIMPQTTLLKGMANLAPGTAAEGTVQALAGPLTEVAGAALKPLAKPLGKAAGAAYDYLATSKMAGGIPKASWEWFKNNVSGVMSKLGAGVEDADAVANDLRTVISNATTSLEDAYKAGVSKLEKSKVPIKINLEDRLGAVFRNIAKDAGFIDPKRNADTPEAKKFFDVVLRRVNDMKAARPFDVYNFQKDLNRAISSEVDPFGKTSALGVDLLQAKDALRLFIEDHPQLKSIAALNSAWHDAKLVEANAKKFTNKDDLFAYLNRALSNPADTLQKRKIDRVTSLVPEAGQAIDEARNIKVAQQLPYFRGATGTGFETAGGLGLLAHYFNPSFIAAAPLLSPRAYAYGYQGAQKLAPLLANNAAPVAAGATATLQALKRLREQNESTNP